MSGHHRLGGRWFTQRADRRVILKASAALAAMAAAPVVTRSFGARAQDVVPVQRNYFSEVLEDAFTTASDTRSFTTTFGITAIAPHWAGTADPGAYVVIQFSQDGTNWDEPVYTSAWADGKDGGDRDGRYYGHLVTVTDFPQYVQYQSFDANDNPVQLPDLILTYYDGSNGPLASDLVTTAAEPTIDQPIVISRAQWGCDERLRYEDEDTSKPIIWPLEYETVDQVVIHHSVTTNLQDPMVTIRVIYEYHAIDRGWGDIGYNYLVDYRGNVYEGRIGGENVVAGHAFGYNYGSSGICAMGDFENVDVTPEAQAGLIWIAAWAGRNLDPFGSKDYYDPEHNVPHRTVATFAGHRDCWPGDTECPGDVLHADLPFIRTAISDVLSGEEQPGTDDKFMINDAVKVNTADANMRSNAGTDFGVVATLALGTKAKVTAGPVTRTGYSWYQIKTTSSGTTGWVAETLLDFDSSVTPVNKFRDGDKVQTNSGSVNIRNAPTTDGDIVATVAAGTAGTITDGPTTANGLIWYRVATSLGDGWVAQDYLSAYAKPPGEFAKGNVVYVDTDVLSIRSSAGLSKPVIGSVVQGTRLTITYAYNRVDSMEWYKVTGGPVDGWVSGDYLTKTAPPTGKPPGEFAKGDLVMVDTDVLSLRSKAGLNQPVLASMPQGTRLTITYAYNRVDGYEWYKVTGSYGSGWVAGAFLADAGPLPIKLGYTVYVEDGPVNMRASASTSGAVVNVLPQDAKLQVMDGPATGSGYTWWKLRSNKYGQGWVVANYIGRR
jgi:uncharacterized protein YgiM (DUF1202 family)